MRRNFKYNGYIIVYGGNGAVAKASAKQFKENNWWIGCIDQRKITHSKESVDRSTHAITNPHDKKHRYQNVNKYANLNILVHPDKNILQQESDILETIAKVLKDQKLDAVICLEGGFTSGNASQKLTNTVDVMWKQNVWPSIISTSIAVAHMKEGGFLCLSGARAALQGTPNMVGYGLAKAAIHQLIKSLALDESALPTNSLCLGLLPVTIDTVMKTSETTAVDSSGWTPTKYITDLLYKWSIGQDRPLNGCLVQFITKNFNTDLTFVN